MRPPITRLQFCTLHSGHILTYKVTTDSESQAPLGWFFELVQLGLALDVRLESHCGYDTSYQDQTCCAHGICKCLPPALLGPVWKHIWKNSTVIWFSCDWNNAYSSCSIIWSKQPISVTDNQNLLEQIFVCEPNLPSFLKLIEVTYTKLQGTISTISIQYP